MPVIPFDWQSTISKGSFTPDRAWQCESGDGGAVQYRAAPHSTVPDPV